MEATTTTTHAPGTREERPGIRDERPVVREERSVRREERSREGENNSGMKEARIYLQPIAAPSILGLFSFAAATFMVGAHMAGWYGGPNAPIYLFPFVAFFGGLAQFLAGMWSYKARDGLATAVHGTWGSFWMAYGLLFLLFGTGAMAPPPGPTFSELGFWYIVLGWVTAATLVAAGGVNLALAGVLLPLMFGCATAATAYISGSGAWVIATGWCFVVSAIVAWYTASALLLEGAYGKPVLPVLYTRRANSERTLKPGLGEPGVIHGQ
jgi:succinate-acetate transporter protein